MIVLSGASASGKTEVAKELAKSFGITKVITTTTRQMRVNEKNGSDYFFVKNDEFQQMIKDDKFVEYTNYNGNYYGSTKDQIQKDKCVVIDPFGLKAYSSIKNRDVVTFFLRCNKQKRYERMLERGDSKEYALNRIKNDRVAFCSKNICKVDFIINSSIGSVKEVAKRVYKYYLKKLQSTK